MARSGPDKQTIQSAEQYTKKESSYIIIRRDHSQVIGVDHVWGSDHDTTSCTTSLGSTGADVGEDAGLRDGVLVGDITVGSGGLLTLFESSSC